MQKIEKDVSGRGNTDAELARAGFKGGGQGARAPGPPPREGPPPNPSYFISGSIDTHIVAYVQLMLVDVTIFPIFYRLYYHCRIYLH